MKFTTKQFFHSELPVRSVYSSLRAPRRRLTRNCEHSRRDGERLRLVRLRKEMDLFDAIGALKEARIAAEARAAKVERSSPEEARAPSPPLAHVDRIPLASLQAGDGSLEARADSLLENLLAARFKAAADHQTRTPDPSPERTKAIAEADAAAELRAAEKARLSAEAQATEEARLEKRTSVEVQQDWLAEAERASPSWVRTPLTRANWCEAAYVYASPATQPRSARACACTPAMERTREREKHREKQ